MDHKYFNALADYLRHEDFYQEGAVLGASLDELKEIQATHSSKLPGSVTEFILNYGNRLPVPNWMFSRFCKTMLNYEYYRKEFMEMKSSCQEYQREDGGNYDILEIEESEILLLFFNPGGHGEYMFYFLKISDIDDPPVYSLIWGDVEQVSDSFSTFIISTFKEYVRLNIKRLNFYSDDINAFRKATHFLRVESIKDLKISISLKNDGLAIPQGILHNKSIAIVEFFRGPYIRIEPILKANRNSLKRVSLKRLRGAPEILSLPKGENIEAISLYSTDLDEVSIDPASLPRITWLELNKVKRLPASIGELTTLQHLSISNTDIPVLPEWVFKLEKLSWLSLQNCGIEQIGDEISKLGCLTFLYLVGNKLTEEKILRLNKLLPEVKIVASGQKE